MKYSVFAVSYFLLLLLSTEVTYSQDKQLTNNESFSIASEAYEQELEINISLPADYDTTSKSYPVLYVLDGQRWFTFLNGTRDAFVNTNLTPNFIVVGIPTNAENVSRFSFFSDARLTPFLKDELIPYVEKSYRISGERMIFGWQYGGAFAIRTIVTNPGLFDAHLAASPFPLTAANQETQNVAAIANSLNDNGSFLYFAATVNEGQVISGTKQLDSLLQKETMTSGKWSYKVFDYEPKNTAAHLTTPFGTIYSGLREYFNDYAILEFADLDEYRNAGGVEYVLSYYENRSKKYGLENTIPLDGMFSLVRLSMINNDMAAFDELVQGFKSRGFLEALNLSWSLRFANFYLDNNEYESAKEIYEKLVSRFPERPTPHNKLGHVYKGLNNESQAIEHFKKAVQLASAMGHRDLNQFQKDLDDIESQ